jgi:transposase-like protein
MSFILSLAAAAIEGTVKVLGLPYEIVGRQIQYENEKLTCRRCNGLASPISGTRNRYRCDECGRQFAAARHSF